MKYFKDKETGEVFAYDLQQVESGIVKKGLVAMGWQEVQKHLKQNEEVKLTPRQISKAQGKAILIKKGIWEDVLNCVENIEDDTERALAEVAINDTTYWMRDSVMLNKLAKNLGITSKELDKLFLEASEIIL